MPIRENLQISHKEFLSTEKIRKEDKTINILELLRTGLSKLGQDGGNTFRSLFSEFNFFFLLIKKGYFQRNVVLQKF